MSVQILIGTLLIGDVPNGENLADPHTVSEDGCQQCVTRAGLSMTTPAASSQVALIPSVSATAARHTTIPAGLIGFPLVTSVHAPATARRQAVHHTMMPPGV